MDIKKIKKSFIKSAVPGQGGLACAASLVNYYGGSVTIDDLRRKYEDVKVVISMLKLLTLLQREGFDANGYKGNIDYLKEEIKSPAVLHIQRDSGEEDFVVFYGWENNKFIVGDPGWGILEYREDELNEVWKSKAFMTMEPGKSFHTAKEQSKLKKKRVFELLKNQKFPLILVASCGFIMAAFLISVIRLIMTKTNLIVPDLDSKQIYVLAAFLLLYALIFNILTRIRSGIEDRGIARLVLVFYEAISFNAISGGFTPGLTISLVKAASRFANTIFSLSYHTPLFFVLFFIAISETDQVHLVQGVVLFAIPFLLLSLLWFSWKKRTDKYKRHLNVESREIDIIVSNYNQRQQIKLLNAEKNYIAAITGLFSFSSGIYRDLNKAKNNIAYWSLLFPLLVVFYFLFFLPLLKDENANEIFGVVGWGMAYLYSVYNLKPIFCRIAEVRETYNFLYDALLKESQSQISQPEIGTLSAVPPISEFEVRGLKVSYPGKPPVFDSLSFKAELGKLTVIQGGLGSGKSTLISALSKLLPISGGDVLVNGRSWDSITTPEWRKMVSVMIQPVELFDTTVIENIGWGRVSSDMDKIINFCKETGFDRFFSKLPDGYGTFIKQGMGISFGERQLVALASALYRKPQILFLDEPLSNYDEEIAEFIHELLQKLKQRMSIVIFSGNKLFTKEADYRFYLCNDYVFNKHIK